jgi:Bacterial low temperature requirement A protein (LtrA)
MVSELVSRPGPDRGAAVRPPVLRTNEEGGERRATWTELFFDLVFVAAVSRTSQILADDPSRVGATWFVFLFVAIAWSWTNFVMYTERFDTDDVPHRLTKAAAMVAVAGVAYAAPEATGDGSVEFALAYVTMRLVLIALYTRLAFRHVEEAVLFREGRWILCAAAAVYLLGITCIAIAAGRRLRAVAVHPVTAVVLLGVAAFGTSLSPPAVVAVVAAALVAEVLYKGTVFGWSGDAASSGNGDANGSS